MDQVQIGLLTAVAGLLSVLLFAYLRGSRHGVLVASRLARPTYLLVGANGAGKTALFQALTENEKGATVSSLEHSVGQVLLPFSNPAIAKPFQIVDYPGHRKYSQLMRKMVVDEIGVKNLKGVVFVIDASSMSLSQEGRLAGMAQELLELLSLTEKTPNGVDFLFAVNKQDLFDSRPVHKVKQMLEEELGKLIEDEISAKGLVREEADVFGETSREFWKATVGTGKFRFEMLEGDMDFIGGSVLKSAVENWENWFDERTVNYGGI